MTAVHHLLAFSFLFAACTPGDITGNPGPGGGADAAADTPDADPAVPDGGASAACVPAVSGVGSGHHNPGQTCIACHAGNSGPDFTVAGTLYDSANGAAPLAGGTITVTDANGAVTTIVSQTNGNFYSSAPLTFPIRIEASRCPDTSAMSSTAAAGDCNSGGCHGAANRIHLP
jgi:hypothetical protein